jgi:hypothetical protein
MDKTIRNILIGLLILGVLTPMGLIAQGDAYGEWNADTLKEQVGFVPAGLNAMSDLWSAPMTDYGFPGSDSTVGTVAGYLASAFVGIALLSGVIYVVGKAAIKDEQ